MKNLTIPLIISLLVHLLLVGVVVIRRADERKRDHQIHLILSPETPVPPDPGTTTREHQPPQPVSPDDPNRAEAISHSPDPLTPSQPPSVRLSISETNRLRREVRKQTFLSAERPSSLQEDLTQRILWSSPSTSNKTEGNHALWPSVNQPTTENPSRFDFIPTETQLQIMATLYKKQKATQLDIYANFAPANPLTAEQLDQNLDYLVKKGFLSRRKISPQNIFGLVTPLGTIPIEMSRKNRLNPVYVYEPTVDQLNLVTYLQTRLYLLQEKRVPTPEDSLTLIPEIRSLQQKIQMLVR